MICPIKRIFDYPHSPKGILDEGTGSEILEQTVLKRQPKHHLFGHVHSKGGQCEESGVQSLAMFHLSDTL